MEKLIREVLLANLALPRYGLATLTWGSVSAIDRSCGLVVIKPSGVPYEAMVEKHMVVIDLAGKMLGGAYRPSRDLATHLEIYRAFPSANGVVHTHSRWATIWAQAGRGIEVYGTTHADYYYGKIPCTRKLTAAEVSDNYELNTGKVIVETFREHALDAATIPGVLVNGHGVFTWGRNGRDAVHNAVVMEEVAMMALHTLQLTAGCQPLGQVLLDKHYFQKQGSDAYYGPKPEM